MRSTPSLRSFPNIAFVCLLPLFVCLLPLFVCLRKQADALVYQEEEQQDEDIPYQQSVSEFVPGQSVAVVLVQAVQQVNQPQVLLTHELEQDRHRIVSVQDNRARAWRDLIVT